MNLQFMQYVLYLQGGISHLNVLSNFCCAWDFDFRFASKYFESKSRSRVP